MRIVARLRRGLRGRRWPLAAPPSAPAAAPPPAPLRGLGEAPAASAPADAGEAELDTLRGELVRELDRLAEGDDGSGSCRRIASCRIAGAGAEPHCGAAGAEPPHAEPQARSPPAVR